MKPSDRNRLTSALRSHVAEMAADIRVKLRGQARDGVPAAGAREIRERALKLHADERVAEDFEVWTDLLSRRAAVLWVLKSVYVRVLEDRGLLSPGRLFDPEAQLLFEKLAPNLGETAFLRWVYRDLASKQGGLPELFSPQPAEVALPSDDLSRKLIEFWRHRDADTQTTWSFANERFEGELMGDLYQELDPVVKERFALCQTPDFVRTFILDRTLTPTIEEFGADQVRLLDPACGSGHFLIDGLKRIVAATAVQHPDWERGKVVRHALDRVVGIDLNDYACGLARARMVMTAAELAGLGTLAAAAELKPHVYWADGLEQVERDDVRDPVQVGLFGVEEGEVRPRATLTRSDVRTALRKVFERKFHAVVANPPYITEKDAARKAYHREKIGKTQRYVSAYREYSLASPFTERCLQLAEKNGFIGLITSNNFMKREFGKPLIEKVLAGVDLNLVVDTSQAYIPFHGTPTVLVFARNRRSVEATVRAVMGKRGESGIPEDPAKGKVWSSIEQGWSEVGWENEYVSVADIPRVTFGKHPWSLGGGGAAELKVQLEESVVQRLVSVAPDIGVVCTTRADDVYVGTKSDFGRIGITAPLLRQFPLGSNLRDWSVVDADVAVFPYNEQLLPVAAEEAPAVHRFLWRYRALLWERREPNGNHRDIGLTWWEWSRFLRRRLTPPTIAFAKIATHNHFVFSRDGSIFSDGSPVVRMASGASEDEYLALLGLLNSSTACFWMKQVFHNKGIRGQGGGITAADWEQFFEFDATKLKLFPVAGDTAAVRDFAAAIDALARERSAIGCASVLANMEQWGTVAVLRARLLESRARDLKLLLRQVTLQEELDWECYRIYGIDDATGVVSPDAAEPLLPTLLPWCLEFVARDEVNREAISRGDEPDEQPTTWFERHRWEAATSLPEMITPATRARIEARRTRIRQNPTLAMIETANYKRRWYRPDYDAEETSALKAWLADRTEQQARDRDISFTIEQLTATMQEDPRFLAVCEVLSGRPDYNLGQIIIETTRSNSVPNHPFHLYRPAGLLKREAWERTWADQRREDAGEPVTPEVPPSYATADFLRTEYWQLRGKLDVPRERFIAFTEVPGRTGANTLYGWAGWTPLQRLKALLAIDEDLEDTGVALADRVGVLDSAWRLLPDVARDDAVAAARLKAELQALVGPSGPSREMLEDWKQRFPPPTGRGERRAAARATDTEAKTKTKPKRKAKETNG